MPAIALTALTRREDEADAMAAGFQVHLHKPVNPAVLVQTVAKLGSGRIGVVRPALTERLPGGVADAGRGVGKELVVLRRLRGHALLLGNIQTGRLQPVGSLSSATHGRV